MANDQSHLFSLFGFSGSELSLFLDIFSAFIASISSKYLSYSDSSGLADLPLLESTYGNIAFSIESMTDFTISYADLMFDLTCDPMDAEEIAEAVRNDIMSLLSKKSRFILLWIPVCLK